MEDSTIYPARKTKDLFYKITLIAYLCSLPNLWIGEVHLPKISQRSYNRFAKIIIAIVSVFLSLEVAAFLTQSNLTTKQKDDLLVYGIAHPIFHSYTVLLAYHEDLVKNVLTHLIVVLKKVHNDLEVERKMIDKSVFYSLAMVLSCILSMCLYTLDECMTAVKTGKTFNIVITAWPNVDDKTALANVVRVLYYVIWWIFMARTLGSYVFVASLTTCLSHQYKNVQSYFYSLNDIFVKDNESSQADKEKKFEEAFRVGIQLHRDTLHCTSLSDKICKGIFSGQIVFNVVTLVVLMTQVLNSERTLMNVLAKAISASSMLTGTGFFMWNAGDVTIEASLVATSVYSSGWQHCQGETSVRIGKLALIAMINAQKPIVFKGLGIIDLSYQSFLSKSTLAIYNIQVSTSVRAKSWAMIVKSSYSVFSVLY